MSRKRTREERLFSMLPQQSLFGFTREQSEHALKEVMDTYQTSLLEYAYQQCGNYEETYDILQRAWLELFVNLSQRGEDGVYGSNTYAWLRKIIFNAASNYRKKQRLSKSLDPSEGLCLLVLRVNPFEHPDAIVARKEFLEELHEALSKISPIQRQVILLRFFMDLKLEDIALQLDIPLSTVKSHLRRGLLNLREAIQMLEIGSHELQHWEGYKNRPTIELHSFYTSNKPPVSLIETSDE
jgi:RNA polymerase sigma-70 factor, ECF subfamily